MTPDQGKPGGRAGKSAPDPEHGSTLSKPRGRSETADYSPTEHSKSVEQRLGELRQELVSERHKRRLVRANLAVVGLAVLVLAAELTVLATRLIDERVCETAVLFAGSAGAVAA